MLIFGKLINNLFPQDVETRRFLDATRLGLLSIFTVVEAIPAVILATLFAGVSGMVGASGAYYSGASMFFGSMLHRLTHKK